MFSMENAKNLLRFVNSVPNNGSAGVDIGLNWSLPVALKEYAS